MKKIICVLVCMLLVVPALITNVFAEVPYDHMIGLYNMEGELKDSITGAIGQLYNGASLENDAERGSVLHINNDGMDLTNQDGALDEGQWAELAASYVPNSNEMTVSIWFKQKEGRNWARAIDMGDGEPGGGPERFLNITPYANTAGGTYMIGTVNENDGSLGISNNRDRIWADPAEDGKWYHAVLVIKVDGSSPNILYVNGVPFKSGHDDLTEEPAEISPSHILETPNREMRNAYLGRSSFEANADQMMNGYIDDITIFDVALTAEQVAELMNADLKNGNPLNAVAANEPESETAAPETVEEAAEVTEPAAPQPAAASSTPAAPQTGDAALIFIVLSLVSASAFIFIRKRTAK